MNIQQILKTPQLKVNLSGEQITEVLNSLLWSALQPIFYHTNLGRVCCAEILTKTWYDHRRKISILDKQDCIDTLYNCIIHKSKLSWEYYKDAKIERSISNKILNLFNDFCANYIADEIEYCKKRFSLEHYEKVLGCSYKKLGFVVKNANHFATLYYDFKHKIMQKYYLLAWQQVCRRAKLTTSHIDTYDLFKNFTIAIGRAIDKYSEEKGSLGAFIKWQFKSTLVNPEDGYEYGQAYIVPHYTKLELAKNKNTSASSFSVAIDEVVENTVSIPEDYTVLDRLSSDKLINIINDTPGTEVASLILGIAKK